ncbi:MAG: ABC transporter permease [Candidatus Hodarchaeota archaeon]
MNLIKYTIRRLLVMIPVLITVLTITFILSRLMPGDPVIALLRSQGLRPRGQEFPIEFYLQAKKQLGLDKPILIQYFMYLRDLFSGNWGVSVVISCNEPVWNLIMEKLPRTIDLTIFSMILASFFGIKAGIISATNKDESKDTIIRSITLIGVAIPAFFLAILLQYIFSIQFPLFDPTGYRSIHIEDPPSITSFYIIDAFLVGEWYKIGDYVWHLLLPVCCLSFIIFASIARQTRGSMLDEFPKDYIRTARAKGCKNKDVINSHVLRNALIPTVTIIGLNFAGLLSGAIFTEIIFDLDGIGQLLINAIDLRDYWVISALIFLITFMFIIINLLTDIIYAGLDPRIRYR